MMINDTIKDRIVTRVEQCFRKVMGYVPAYTIVYKDLGTTAGTASRRGNVLTFHPGFLKNQPDEFIHDTVAHEVAHLIQFAMYPMAKQAHGPEWKSIMRALGLDPTRCHSYSLTNLESTRARPRDYRYMCSCREFFLTSIRHKRIQQGKVFTCLTCKATLVHQPT